MYISEHNIYIFLLQLFILLGAARILGEIFNHYKQPPLTAEIIVGVIFGPTIFGRFLPNLFQHIFPVEPLQSAMFETVAWLGVFFLILEMGLELDFSLAWRQRGDALKIAITDIIVPMSLSFSLALILPQRYLVDPSQRLVFALFMATVMTISALPTTARALRDLNIHKTDLGFLILSAFSVNDIIGWLIFTFVIGLFTHANVELIRIIAILGSSLGFSVICLTLGRKFANWAIQRIHQARIAEPAASLSFICVLGAVCGSITQAIGMHALFGFFLAGIMAGGAVSLPEKTRQVISQMVYALFVPLFFVSIGLKMDFIKHFDLALVLFVSGVGILGKFTGAWLGVNFTQINKQNRLVVAVAHTAGGSMEIVVGSLALKYGLINPTVFEAIVFGALISSVLLGPALSFALNRRKKISVAEFFPRGSVIANLKSDLRDQAIRELSEKAADTYSHLTFEEIFDAVMAREKVMGTAIEYGIAFPHARMKQIKKTAIFFGRSLAGIDWNSPDGNPTHFVFLILTPANDYEAQTQVLALIAKTMANANLRERLLQLADTGGIWYSIHEGLITQHLLRKKTKI